ncbi:MAG: hypothetical protein GY943_30930 [Chloroflexi bacterium]|nr:hypothetical protein [Chloroflexota bacterium]
MFTGKIFGIGFHKTGTSSLARALDQLGYSVTGSFGLMDTHIATNVLAKASEIVPQYDAFQDNPWPIIYKELDAAYPGSKFILTLRPTDAWLASAVRHFNGKTTPMREWIYGVGDPRGYESIYRARYERHNAAVTAFFKDRPQDFLQMRLTEGEGWEKLCPFIGMKIPNFEFPHSNSYDERSKLTNKLKRGFRRVMAIAMPTDS